MVMLQSHRWVAHKPVPKTKRLQVSLVSYGFSHFLSKWRESRRHQSVQCCYAQTPPSLTMSSSAESKHGRMYNAWHSDPPPILILTSSLDEPAIQAKLSDAGTATVTRLGHQLVRRLNPRPEPQLSDDIGT